MATAAAASALRLAVKDHSSGIYANKERSSWGKAAYERADHFQQRFVLEVPALGLRVRVIEPPRELGA
jgi:hypothetical protein